MLNLILSGIMDLLGSAISKLFELFSGIFDFSLEKFAEMFPIANTLYDMLRAIGLGLVLAIAIFQLMKYFVGPMARTTEKPQVILLRTFFAIFLVYMAPYVLDQIFTFTGLIYNDIMNVQLNYGAESAVGSALTSGTGWLASFATDLFTWTNGLGPTGILFGIVLGIVLIIQFLKMMLEIVERYLMTILLIYSSPLAMSTFTSESTSQILKKWVSMFIAQCILLILSVWGCVLFINCLTVSSFYDADGNLTANPLIIMIYAYAIVKIVKRMDNYLQQVGLNAAGMGGMSLLDSIMATAGAMKMMGGGKNGKGNVLSNALNLKKHSGLYQGFAGMVANRGNGKSAWANFWSGSTNASNVIGMEKRAGKAGAAFKEGFTLAKAKGGTGIDSVMGGVAAAKESMPTTYSSFAEANAAHLDAMQARDEKMKANNAVVKDLGVLDHQKENLAACQQRFDLANTQDPTAHAEQSEALGRACANAWRSTQGMDAETVAGSGILDDIKTAAASDPYVARTMMSDIIENGGGVIEGDLADTIYDSYAGNALANHIDVEAVRENSTLALSQNKNGNREVIEYQTQATLGDGQRIGLSATNEYGSNVARDKDGEPQVDGNGVYVTVSTLVDRYSSKPKSSDGGRGADPVFVMPKPLHQKRTTKN